MLRQMQRQMPPRRRMRLFTVEEEPGMTNDFYMYGNFYVTEIRHTASSLRITAFIWEKKRWMMRQAGK